MSENHDIQCSIERRKDEFLALETETRKLRRVTTTTHDGGINRLPDDVLSCVFLILHWEDLMNAGLVSRRWERLCKRVCSSLRVLDYNWDTMFTVPQAHCSSPLVECPSNSATGGHFNCHDFEDRFFTSVERSMNNHGNASISSFKFEYCIGKLSTASTALLDHWISCALDKGATELDLKYMCSYQCILSKLKIDGPTPCGLSKVANLKHLSLSWCILPEGTVLQMPCLKSLRLVSVKLVKEVFRSFLSGCRNLESIRLEYCEFTTLIIPGLLKQLKCLWMAADEYRFERTIVICSPYLHTYSYCGESVFFSLCNVPCLKNLCLEISQPYVYHMGYLFGRIPEENAMLESLTLSFQSYKMQVIRIPERISKFNQLKQLEIYAYMDLRLNMQKIINILDACPLLEKFSMVTICLKEDETTVHPESFVYKYLKEVFIGRIAFTESYVKLAHHLLEHSIALEKMILGLKLPQHRRGDRYMLADKRLSYKNMDRSRESYRLFRKKEVAKVQAETKLPVAVNPHSGFI